MNEIDKLPSVEKEVYKNTFLHNTVVTITYDEVTKNSLTGDFDERKNAFFKNFFNVDQSDRDFVNQGISLSKVDKSQGLLFTKAFCMANVNRSVYKTFLESMMPNVYALCSFLRDIAKVGRTRTVEVRKINMFPVEVSKSVDLKLRCERQKVLANVLTKECLGKHHETESIPVKGAIADFGQRVLKDKDGYIYRIKTGLMPAGENKTYVVVDLSVTYPMALGMQDVESKTMELNKLEFDLFHWSVNPEIISNMK